MRTRQHPDAHQKFSGNFATCEVEGLLEKLDPISLCTRVVSQQPIVE